ncbi:MAG: CrcB family protein [Nocardioides sp.]
MKPTAGLCLAVAAGGALGAVLRHLLGLAVDDGSGFPITTFAINVTGCFALGLLPPLAAARGNRAWAVAIGPGLLGGFTTMSAYAEQARALLDDGRTLLASTYVAGTLLACLAAVVIAGLLRPTRLEDRETHT